MKKQEEERYYPLVKEALEDFFRISNVSFDFEVTSRKKSLLRQFLPENFKTLTRDVRPLPAPDIMGFVWRRSQQNRKLVVAEFKLRPKYMDIFQVKGYDELYNPDLIVLMSLNALSESSKFTINYIRNNTDLLKTKRNTSQICIHILHRINGGKITFGFRADEPDLPHIDIDLLFSGDE